MENYILSCKRRVKAASEKFYLLEVCYHPCFENDIICNILNSSNKEYTICICEYNDESNRYAMCSCPDSLLGGNICKHIYWLGLKKIGHINPNYWTTNLINLFFQKYYLPNSSFPGRNDTCPICLEHMIHEYQPTIRCIKGCDNSVHTKCWTKYLLVSGNFDLACVCCRQRTMPKWVPYHAPIYTD